MSCRAPGCDKNEWMARKFCARHWKMLPVELQTKIRKLVGARRWNPDMSEFQALVDEANAIITAAEKEEHANAHITLYRTRMAAVSGLVVTIRTLPFPDILAQLKAEVEHLLANDLDVYRAHRVGIERDMAFLDFFSYAQVELGRLIKAFAPPAPASEGEQEAVGKSEAGGKTTEIFRPEVVE
jgi:hypothetical protein